VSFKKPKLSDQRKIKKPNEKWNIYDDNIYNVGFIFKLDFALVHHPEESFSVFVVD